jgi:hypothetical protein
MRVAYTFALVMLVPFLSVAQRTVDRGPTESYVARVQVLAFGSTGQLIGAPEVFGFVEISSKEDLTSTFKDGVAKNVPFGTYVLDAGLTGFSREARVVRVAKNVAAGVKIPKVPV